MDKGEGFVYLNVNYGKTTQNTQLRDSSNELDSFFF